MTRRKDIKEDIQAILNVVEIPYPSIGLDIDGVVDECSLFCRTLTAVWPGKVYVVSYRSDMEKAVKFLERFNIRYDEIILVSSFDQKAVVIQERGISTFFDDQPEMLKNVSPMCQVMLVRNEGNFDFEDKKWMLSKETGKLV